MANCGSRSAFPEWMKAKKDARPWMFAMLSSFTRKKKKKEAQCKNKSGLNIPHKAKTPWSCLCTKRTFGLKFIQCGDHFLQLFEDQAQTTLKRKCTTSKCKENVQKNAFVLFEQNKVYPECSKAKTIPKEIFKICHFSPKEKTCCCFEASFEAPCH